MEKTGEELTYLQGPTNVTRMDYASPLFNELVFSLAVEELLGIELPDRAVWIRMLMTELNRISSHMLFMATNGMDLGAVSMMLYGWREREELLRFFEAVTGLRMNHNYIRPGGVAADLPGGWEDDLVALLDVIPERLEEFDLLMTGQPIWRERLQGVGVITAEEALALGVTGPILRSTGYAWDLRRDEPYLAYDQVDFDVIVGSYGDCFDRYAIRLNEIRESIRIVRQIVDKMPAGDYRSQDKKVTPPPRARIDESMEALIHHFKIFTEGFKVPEGEVYVAVESPRGELGTYVIGGGAENHKLQAGLGPLLLGIWCALKPAVEAGTHGLDLEGKLSIIELQSPLEAQHRFLFDQLAEPRFKLLPLPGSGAAHDHRMHGHMGVVMVLVIIVVVVVLVVLVFVVLVLVVVALLGQPGPRSVISCRWGAELRGQQQTRINRAAGHRQHGGSSPQPGPQAFDHLVEGFGGQSIGAADQHQIGGLQLVGEEVFDGTDVVEAGVGEALGFDRSGIAHHMAGGQGFTIHHRDHRMDPGAGADRGPAEGRQQGLRKGQTTGFHHNAVELVGPLQQAGHGGQEFILHRAAEAAISQLHQAALQLLCRAEATGRQQLAIDAHLAKFIYQHSQAQAALEQQMAEQGGLASA
jgi:NADH:ubiquinone oxidoreductase subunit D